jgi:hypothetical protein
MRNRNSLTFAGFSPSGWCFAPEGRGVGNVSFGCNHIVMAMRHGHYVTEFNMITNKQMRN